MLKPDPASSTMALAPGLIRTSFAKTTTREVLLMFTLNPGKGEPSGRSGMVFKTNQTTWFRVRCYPSVLTTRIFVDRTFL